MAALFAHQLDLVKIRAVLVLGFLFFAVPTWGIWAAAIAPGIATILIHPYLIWTISPYKAWDMKHDLMFVILSAVVITVVLWIHADTLISVVKPVG